MNALGQNDGIQQLLQAEKEAAKKVAEARKKKTLRLKQAKQEAQNEVEQYRLQQEAEYCKAEEGILGSKTDIEHQINIKLVKELEVLNSGVSQNKEKVQHKLLMFVYNIKPELHQNFKIVN